MASGRTIKLPTVNKQIIEIKKRIQLSEGQRKALFEDIENERKRDTDEILTLKKEISKLVVSLHEHRKSTLKTRMPGMPISKLRTVIGHVGDKTCNEIIQILDLHTIDRTKQLDLINYRIKQKEKKLRKLAEEYQKLLIQSQQRYPSGRKQKNSEKVVLEMKNKINAVEVQWREAEHVRCRYKDIKRTLLDDAARFESKIKQIGEDLNLQDAEIEKLQKINAEACKLRGAARHSLLIEEKFVLKSGNERESQAAEGKRLVQERKLDLESLEKHFYQGPKPSARQDVDDDSPKEMDAQSLLEDPMDVYVEIFQTLKEATGGTGINDVLKKFQTQETSRNRLSDLRENSEKMKTNLLNVQEKYLNDLEKLKFAESKGAELNAGEIEEINVNIASEQKKLVDINIHIDNIDTISKSTLEKLQAIYFGCKETSTPEDDPLVLLKYFKDTLIKAMKRIKEEELSRKMEGLEITEEKWLPSPYVDLIRRTPLPQQGSPTPLPPTVSDEEEEVPSRSFLKRQAQLVMDAKIKRKTMRFQLPKTK